MRVANGAMSKVAARTGLTGVLGFA
jgi:hypothetical protein